MRSPLVWLGEPDPVDSIEEIRKNDQTLSELLELFSMWEGFLLLDMTYTTARIIEIAEETTTPPSASGRSLRPSCLRSPLRAEIRASYRRSALAEWLRKNSGRVVDMRTTRLKNAASYTGRTGRTSDILSLTERCVMQEMLGILPFFP